MKQYCNQYFPQVTIFLHLQLVAGPGTGAEDHMLLLQGLEVKGVPLLDVSQSSSNQNGLRF